MDKAAGVMCDVRPAFLTHCKVQILTHIITDHNKGRAHNLIRTFQKFITRLPLVGV